MPVTPTYPGVYIEEIPSGVRTITGVSTSITAFIGWARKGPVDKAQRILSWEDFVRHFDGLDQNSVLGYSVRHFFDNGGKDTYVIRLVHSDASASHVSLPGVFDLEATNPGIWADKYSVTIKHRTDPGYTDRFRLDILQEDPEDPTRTIMVESFTNLSMSKTDQRFVETVVTEESAIIKLTVTAADVSPTAPPPPETTLDLTNGNDGTILSPDDAAFDIALTTEPDGVYLLEHVDIFNLLCVPGETTPATLAILQKYCKDNRAFLIADSASNDTQDGLQSLGGPDGALTGANSLNSAFYFPWLRAPDPLQENRPREYPPCGFVAGIYARTDGNRGVWKAPAGIDASLTGVTEVTKPLSDVQNGTLNPLAINCIRNFPVYGHVIWGARTLQGNDERGSEWKYIPVRRTALFIEESLYRGTKWVVFEPNDEPLWAQIRLNIGAFMHRLFRQGAFQGQSPKEAYLVKCDKETTTQTDINLGIVNILVGFAPLKPAEFVIIKIQQIAGQIQT